MGLSLEAMLEAMAEYYSINLGDEVRKGMAEKARRGELQTSPPFGYRAEGNRLTPIPQEAETVRELFRRFLTPGSFYAREGSDYGYGCRLPFDQEELVASLVLAPRQGTERPRAIVLEHTVDDYADQSQGDALSLEIAKSVYTWLGYVPEDYVKFCFRQKGGHGTEPWQTAYIAEYIRWYFFDEPMSGAAAALLNTDPFAADVLDGLDGWERNYGGLKAVAPWLETGPDPVPVADSKAEGSPAAPAEAPPPAHASEATPEPTTSPLPAPRPKGPGALIAAALGVLAVGGAVLALALNKRKKK